jgi:hypothetical protein
MREEDSITVCPGCGLRLPKEGGGSPDRCNASPECLQAYSDLLCYTVAKQDPEFIHQHAVDAYAAQHAGGTTRNITVPFGIIGLYLALEKGYTGKQVQRAHMQIAKLRKDWPRLEPPSRPASINVMDVLQAPDGGGKDAMIRRWMAAVWECWADRQAWVRKETVQVLAISGK